MYFMIFLGELYIIIIQKFKIGFVAESIKLGDLSKSLLNLLSNYHYELNILEDARSLMTNDVIDDLIRLDVALVN